MSAPSKSTSDVTAWTWIVEERLLGEALATEHPIPDLSPHEFQIDTNANLYALMQRCYHDMGTLSVEVFADYVQTVTGLNIPDVVERLARERCPKGASVESYIGMLKRANAKRDLEEVLKDRLPSMAIDGRDPEAVREEAIKTLQKIVTASPRNRVQTLKALLPGVLNEIERRFDDDKLPGVPTGFPTLDQLTGGWQGGDLNLLAARPAVGKTAMALNFALAAARAGKTVGFVSTEQPGEQLTQRLISIVGRVPAWKLRSPSRLTDDEWPRLTNATMALDKLAITIADDPAPSIDRVMSYGRVMQCDLLIVDYAQRIKAPGTIYERVSAVALGLKELAREQGIPVVALAQINRAGASGARMEHLKGSGDLEQEADSIMILERDTENEAAGATLTLEKNRHGPVGQIDLVFDGPCLRFGELDKRHAYDN